MATNPRQYIKRGSYVLFKFFVDGEALSEVTHKVAMEKTHGVLTLFYCLQYEIDMVVAVVDISC